MFFHCDKNPDPLESAATGRDKCDKTMARLNNMYARDVDAKSMAIVINQLVI